MVADEILRKWVQAGYPGISMNLWHGSSLYVNIAGYTPFCYRLDEPFGKASCKITSGKPLPKELFSSAALIGHFIYSNKRRIMDEMADGAYYGTYGKKVGACAQGIC